jgi:murein DD-endopeptidase MepM/ murein hydrolase activator NlpD
MDEENTTDSNDTSLVSNGAYTGNIIQGPLRAQFIDPTDQQAYNNALAGMGTNNQSGSSSQSNDNPAAASSDETIQGDAGWNPFSQTSNNQSFDSDTTDNSNTSPIDYSGALSLLRGGYSPSSSQNDSYSSSNVVSAPDGTTTNMTQYNSHPGYGNIVQQYINQMGKFGTINDIDSYIQKNSPGSTIKGNTIVAAARENNLAPETLAAIIQHEMGGFDTTKGVAAEDNNPGGVTWSPTYQASHPWVSRGSPRPEKEGGFYVKFPNIEYGVYAVASAANHSNNNASTKKGSGGTGGPGFFNIPQSQGMGGPQPAKPTNIYQNLNTNFKNIGKITTGWGGSTKFEKFHPGIDIANKVGTPIPSFTPGKVTSVSTGHQHGENGFGNSVTVTDANGVKEKYNHLSQVLVKPGQVVNKGQEIAKMGDSGSTYSPTGNGTGPHLDLRIKDAYDRYLNPNVYLKNS